MAVFSYFKLPSITYSTCLICTNLDWVPNIVASLIKASLGHISLSNHNWNGKLETTSIPR